MIDSFKVFLYEEETKLLQPDDPRWQNCYLRMREVKISSLHLTYGNTF